MPKLILLHHGSQVWATHTIPKPRPTPPFTTPLNVFRTLSRLEYGASISSSSLAVTIASPYEEAKQLPIADFTQDDEPGEFDG